MAEDKNKWSPGNIVEKGMYHQKKKKEMESKELGKMPDSFRKKIKKMEKSDTPFKRGMMAPAGGHEGTMESPMKKYIGFDKLSSKIQSEGKSKESADAIAASIGRKKYGSKGFNTKKHG